MSNSERETADSDARYHLAHDIRNHLMSATLLVGEAVRKNAEGTLRSADLTDLETEIAQLSAAIQKLLDDLPRL